MWLNRLKWPSKPTIFALLMVGSLAYLLLPSDPLAGARGMTQLIALPQWAAHQVAQKAVAPIRQLAESQLSVSQQQSLLDENEALVNENVALRCQLTDLRATLEELTLLRAHLPATGVVIPAPVIGLDAAPRRDSLLLAKGRTHGVRDRDWVASRLFVEAGEQEGVAPDTAVLARESLIGWVERSASLTSRVVLLSDAYANPAMRVNIAHFDSQSGRYLQVTRSGRVAGFVLRGSGGGRMLIPDIDREFVDAGVVAVGDLVTSDPSDPRLPMAMAIGEITALHHNREQPLLWHAEVVHRYDPKALTQVYLVDLSRGADDRSP